MSSIDSSECDNETPQASITTPLKLPGRVRPSQEYLDEQKMGHAKLRSEVKKLREENAYLKSRMNRNDLGTEHMSASVCVSQISDLHIKCMQALTKCKKIFDDLGNMVKVCENLFKEAQEISKNLEETFGGTVSPCSSHIKVLDENKIKNNTSKAQRNSGDASLAVDELRQGCSSLDACNSKNRELESAHAALPIHEDCRQRGPGAVTYVTGDSSKLCINPGKTVLSTPGTSGTTKRKWAPSETSGEFSTPKKRFCEWMDWHENLQQLICKHFVKEVPQQVKSRFIRELHRIKAIRT